MSQLSQNQTIQSIVTDPESAQKKGIFKRADNHLKKRPTSAFPSEVCNDDNASIGTTGGDTRVRKLGHLPSYLKKETKSSVESQLNTKYKKFKTAKKGLAEQQSNLINFFEELQALKDKFRQLGGRNFKLETLELIQFSGGENQRCGDGDHQLRCGDVFKPTINSQIIEFEREIQRIRGKVKDGLLKLKVLNADAFKQIQESGTKELQYKIKEIFSKVDEGANTVNKEQDMSMQLLLEKLQQFRNPLPEEVQPTEKAVFQEEEIARLRTTVQNLEIQGKMLQSDVDVKSQEIEYLKNKEMACSKSSDNIMTDRNELHSQMLAQKDMIDDYRNKLNEHLEMQEILEAKVRQLEDTVGQQRHQMEENFLKFKNDLSSERRKYEELGQLLEETKNANSMVIQTYGGPSFELVSNQLAVANEDIKELQFKISKREKQIQSLKQMINTESNKMNEYDRLLCKYDELRQQDLYKSKEMQQLKEKLLVRTGTVNSQILTINELKKQLMAQDASGSAGCARGPLQDEQKSKFSEHERIIQKLENNKIRSNVLRDQLLDRISMLEKENEDMKAQIRKFHEDFTINRFMYDEQRRKKRLTEILVKQYQK